LLFVVWEKNEQKMNRNAVTGDLLRKNHYRAVCEFVWGFSAPVGSYLLGIISPDTFLYALEQFAGEEMKRCGGFRTIQTSWYAHWTGFFENAASPVFIRLCAK
jgi:hypothetical protein